MCSISRFKLSTSKDCVDKYSNCHLYENKVYVNNKWICLLKIQNICFTSITSASFYNTNSIFQGIIRNLTNWKVLRVVIYHITFKSRSSYWNSWHLHKKLRGWLSLSCTIIVLLDGCKWCPQVCFLICSF